MHVAIPHAGHERLAFAVDDLCAGGRLYFGRRADLGDHAFVDYYRLVFQETQTIGIEQFDVVKATGVSGFLANDLANAGMRAASASPCAFSSLARSLS